MLHMQVIAYVLVRLFSQHSPASDTNVGDYGLIDYLETEVLTHETI